jgi:hypothetical protein
MEMAATKTKKSRPKTPASNKSKARPGNNAKKARPAASSRKRSPSKSKTTASKPAPSKPQAALEAVEETAKDAGGAVKDAGGMVGRAASKAKVPLLAGGAALAGAAGGLALGARQSHHRNGLGGFSSKDLAKAARKAGDVGAQVGEIALEVRRARESTNGNGKTHRSPIEVVLQGLTSRGSHS